MSGIKGVLLIAIAHQTFFKHKNRIKSECNKNQNLKKIKYTKLF